jgi:hypothetical protein
MNGLHGTQEYGYIISSVVIFWVGFFVNKLWACLKNKSLTPAAIGSRFFGVRSLGVVKSSSVELTKAKLVLCVELEYEEHLLGDILAEIQSDVGWIEGVEKVRIVELTELGEVSED